MKKIILVSLVSTLVFAKFPHETNAKSFANTPQFLTNASSIQSSNDSENFEYSRADMEGKILAAEYLMKKQIKENARETILELLMRSSTVVKNNYEAREADKVHGVEDIIENAKRIDQDLMVIDLDETSLKHILELEEEVKELYYRFEAL